MQAVWSCSIEGPEAEMNRKAQVDNIVELLVDIPSDFSDDLIQRGTEGW
jgi:hypothetical protein